MGLENQFSWVTPRFGVAAVVHPHRGFQWALGAGHALKVVTSGGASHAQHAQQPPALAQTGAGGGVGQPEITALPQGTPGTLPLPLPRGRTKETAAQRRRHSLKVWVYFWFTIKISRSL